MRQPPTKTEREGTDLRDVFSDPAEHAAPGIIPRLHRSGLRKGVRPPDPSPRILVAIWKTDPDGTSVQAIDKCPWPDDMADMPKNDVLVMPGLFAEPDEFFLRRQRRAFGSDYC